MIISQILNNNVVTSVIDDKEVLVMGKSIGFKSKKGQEIDNLLVEKIYYLHTDIIHNHENIKEIIANTSLTYITLAEKIIKNLEYETNKHFDEMFAIFLADHLSLAIKRAKLGKYVENIMWAEIKRVYPIEYNLGKKIVRHLNSAYNVNLGRDEAAFLALHVVNGYVETTPLESINIIEDIRYIITLVSTELDLDLAPDMYANNRFTSHLNYLLQRIYRNEYLDNSIDIKSFQFLQSSYPLENSVLSKVTEYFIKNENYELNDLEKQYFLLHLISLNGRKVK